ncbi:MAG: hypothetical protein ABIQ04_04495 [Candidatus Saccharimonadales bacterium]
MKTPIKNLIFGLLFVATSGGALLTTAFPQPVAAAANECDGNFFGIPAWYNGLAAKKDNRCQVTAPATGQTGLPNFIWHIALNVVQIILTVAGYLAAVFIIVGGFKYITSAGSADASAKARKTIMNAVVGLVISIFSVAIVNVVTGTIAGTVDPATGIPKSTADAATLSAILNTVYFWAGIISVVMIIIGGLLYTISGGNSSNITKAKDTIIYSVVGLVVVIMAFALTQVVIGRF